MDSEVTEANECHALADRIEKLTAYTGSQLGQALLYRIDRPYDLDTHEVEVILISAEQRERLIRVLRSA